MWNPSKAARITTVIVTPKLAAPSSARLLSIDAPIEESTNAAYVMAQFGVGSWPLDGNVGLRVVQTDERMSSARSVPEIAAIVPIVLESVYTDSYGWVDGSFTYQMGEKASLSLEGLNLTRTVRASHYGVRTRPQNHWLNDRQISITATLRF